MTSQDQDFPDPGQGPSRGFSDLLAALSVKQPAAADITACLDAFDDVAPRLRALVINATNDAAMSQDDIFALNHGLYILASRRDVQTFQPLLRLLARGTTPQPVRILLKVRFDLPRILANVFDGDLDALLAIASNRALAPRYRISALEAAAYLAWKGTIPRDSIHAFLRTFPVDGTAGTENEVVGSWMMAIALLGMRDLAPLVYRRMTLSHFGVLIAGRPDFDELLDCAEIDPTDLDLLKTFGLSEIDDAVAEIARRGGILDEDFLDPVPDDGRAIEDIVVELLTTPRWGPDIINACLARIRRAVPLLRAEVLQAAATEPLSRHNHVALCRSLYVLGQARDRRTCQPLLRLLRRPPQQLSRFLKSMFPDLAGIIVSVFDWNTEALFSLIEDRSVATMARSYLLSAAAFLTFDGRIARERMTRCLAAFDVDSLGDDEFEQFLVRTWICAIAMLGLRDLLPRVERKLDGTHSRELQKFRKGSDGAEGMLQEILTNAEQNPYDDEIFYELGSGYVDELIDLLSKHREPFLCTNPMLEELEEKPQRPGKSGVRASNPMRNVGRNDPCPCGSGLKAKKCCLAKK